jgi:hypothetical protein
MSRKRRFEERCRAAAAVLLAAALAPAVHAQETGRVLIDVGNCVELNAPGERLDCFEREVAAHRPAAPGTPASAPAPAAPAPTASVPAASPPAAQRIGIPPAAAPAPAAAETRRDRREREEEPARQEIVATVTDLRVGLPNAWSITLDNGQVWRQSPPKWYALRPGMQVRLSPTNWGDSYRLSAAELSGFIQVQRVR